MDKDEVGKGHVSDPHAERAVRHRRDSGLPFSAHLVATEFEENTNRCDNRTNLTIKNINTNREVKDPKISFTGHRILTPGVIKH